MKRLFQGILLIIVPASFLLSCGGSAPVLEETDWKLFFRDDGASRYEELGIFFRYEDLDGEEDVVEAVVSQEEEDLIWRFDRDLWKRGSDGERSWWGLPSLKPLAGERLPEGFYVFSVMDLAGRTESVSFRPNPERASVSDLDWPEVALTDDGFVLSGPYETAHVYVRNPEGLALAVIALGNQTPSALPRTGEEASWEAYVPMGGTGAGFLLGPFPMN